MAPATMETVYRFLRKVNIELPHDPALQSHYRTYIQTNKQKKTDYSQRKKRMFEKRSSTDEEDVVQIYNKILLNNEKNKIMPFAATWMQI